VYVPFRARVPPTQKNKITPENVYPPSKMCIFLVPLESLNFPQSFKIREVSTPDSEIRQNGAKGDKKVSLDSFLGRPQLAFGLS
jgi:hypothetical protein